MLAAAPGSSRCSGSGSFLASARGCRPPALVDRVSRCFVVSLEVFDAWLPPRRRRRVAPPANASKRVSGRRPRAARMSICAPSVAANSSAAAARLNHLARGMSASPARAQARRKSRSEATRRRAAGCTTLTATRSPRRPPFVTSFLRTCAGVVVVSTTPVKKDAASDRRVHLGDAARADGRRVDVEHVAPVGPERRLEGALRVAPRVRRRPVLQMGEAVAERAREAVLARRGPLRELDGRRPRRARRPEAVAPPAVLVEAAEGGLRAVFARLRRRDDVTSAGDAIAARRRNFAWTYRTPGREPRARAASRARRGESTSRRCARAGSTPARGAAGRWRRRRGRRPRGAAARESRSPAAAAARPRACARGSPSS